MRRRQKTAEATDEPNTGSSQEDQDGEAQESAVGKYLAPGMGSTDLAVPDLGKRSMMSDSVAFEAEKSKSNSTRRDYPPLGDTHAMKVSHKFSPSFKEPSGKRLIGNDHFEHSELTVSCSKLCFLQAFSAITLAHT